MNLAADELSCMPTCFVALCDGVTLVRRYFYKATCRISLSSCREVKHAFHEDSKMAAACLQTAAMPHPLRPETDRSSYTNQPPTWQPHAFRQLPPGLRKPSKEHFLIFHRYSTELFRGWACLLDFCKPLANMGPCKMVNVSAFGTPSLLK